MELLVISTLTNSAHFASVYTINPNDIFDFIGCSNKSIIGQPYIRSFQGIAFGILDAIRKISPYIFHLNESTVNFWEAPVTEHLSVSLQ